jgi:CRP-like cAMP-binding protein
MKDVLNELCTCMMCENSVFNFLNTEDLKEITASAGQILWNQGDRCDYVACIVSGRVEIKRETEFKGKHVVVGVLGSGSIVGALCILDASPRAVTAVALEDVSLVTISLEKFEELINLHPALGSQLMKGMLLSVSIRLKKSYDRLSKFF